MKTLFVLCAVTLIACGGDQSVAVSNQQSQGQGGEVVDVASVCSNCIWNASDGLTDEECVGNSGLSVGDC